MFPGVPKTPEAGSIPDTGSNHRNLLMDLSVVIQTWQQESKKYTKKATKSDCLLWTGRGYGDKGYGLLKAGDLMILAHRAAFTASKMGDIKPGSIIKQSCNNKRCCLPAHLSEEHIGRV